MISRFRVVPTPAQEAGLVEHCRHARYVWNLGLEQRLMWRPDRRASPPGYAEQGRQLTEARATEPWLAAGSSTVQQQALRDLDRAWQNFYAGTHRRPTWRKAGRNEGFRIVGAQARRVRKLNRRWAEVIVPKVGWVRFRLSRPVPAIARSYRITRDWAGRWHIAFAVVPGPIPAPHNGEIVGVDRGVAVSAALSTGDLLRLPPMTAREASRLLRLQRRLARAKRGSNRRSRVKTAIARIKAAEANRRKDWVEKTSTALARRFDLIRVEDLRIQSMTRSARGTIENPGRNVRQKAGLNRSILASGWGQLVQRLEHKAPGRVQKVHPAYTSQTCSACMNVDREARESQARFACRSCGHTENADVNAARNIAAGRAVTARGGPPWGEPANREPQPILLSV
ncbi:transposase [Actinopolymorpha pittospori]|uniref:RNA-guided endonuclease InsQ/TnpB family protein n=1 Tax=Actinopolymorpha pittospori TaxID=648752 RepID=UPI0031EDF4DF